MCLNNSDSAITRTLFLLPTGPSYRDTPVQAIVTVVPTKPVQTNESLFCYMFEQEYTLCSLDIQIKTRTTRLCCFRKHQNNTTENDDLPVSHLVFKADLDILGIL